MSLLINNSFKQVKKRRLSESEDEDIKKSFNIIFNNLRKARHIRPYRKFRIIAICIFNILLYYKEIKILKFSISSVRKEEQLKIYGFSMALIRTWIIEKSEIFIQSIKNHEYENLNFTTIKIGEENIKNIEKIFIQIKFRVEYFLKLLIIVTIEMPPQAKEFLYDLAKHGSYIDPRCLTNFEKQRLYFDKYHTLYNVDESTK